MTAQKSGVDLAESGCVTCVRQCEHPLSASILSDNDHHRRVLLNIDITWQRWMTGRKRSTEWTDEGRERGSEGEMMGDLGISDKRL